MYAYEDEGSGLKLLKINKSGKTIKLPNCVMYSRGGMVPHLTDHNVDLLNKDTDMLWMLPLSSIYEQPGPDVMEKYPGTFHDFSSSQDNIWVLNTNDTCYQKTDVYKYNEENSISIWAPSGRRKITPEEYMKIMEVFSFDIAIPPSDTIPAGVSKKRCLKSADRTQKFLDKCLKIKEEKKLAVPMMGVIEGGDSTIFREKSAKHVASKNVDAYVIGGFDMISSNWKELLQLSLQHLQDEKAKMMFGVLTPVEVLDAVELGVDVFDTVIAYDVTERGCALNFKYTGSQVNGASTEEETVTKKMRREECENTRKDLSKFEINLNDKRYFDDDKPLVAGCQCYACTHHVRAYVHHLLVTKEMLASVLLMMHNLTYWLDFFKEIRKSIEEKKFQDLQSRVRDNS